MKLDCFLHKVKQKASEKLPDGFTGLGIIVLNSGIGKLPLSPLLSVEDSFESIIGVEAIVDYLFSLSNVLDKRHDGFHVVSEQEGLLRVSQYFSPVIPTNLHDTVFDVGARYRTAQYGSLYPNISSIIVVNQNKDISIAVNGKMDVVPK